MRQRDEIAGVSLSSLLQSHFGIEFRETLHRRLGPEN